MSRFLPVSPSQAERIRSRFTGPAELIAFVKAFASARLFARPDKARLGHLGMSTASRAFVKEAVQWAEEAAKTAWPKTL